MRSEVQVLPGPPSCRSRAAPQPLAAGPARAPPNVAGVRSHLRASPVRRSKRGLSSAGRAPDLHSGGRRFDPVRLHHLLLRMGLGAGFPDVFVFVRDSFADVGVCSVCVLFDIVKSGCVLKGVVMTPPATCGPQGLHESMDASVA